MPWRQGTRRAVINVGAQLGQRSNRFRDHNTTFVASLVIERIQLVAILLTSVSVRADGALYQSLHAGCGPHPCGCDLAFAFAEIDKLSPNDQNQL